MKLNELEITRARASRTAIERLYIEMRHIFNKGSYRDLGDRGEVLTEALLTLSPEIYGSMSDQEKVELDGLVYIVERLPKGIEECRFVKLVSEEGYRDAGFPIIVPAKRRRNCYRIDSDHIYIEVTRGRSEIYDILTHLTFMYIEAEKIYRNVEDDEGNLSIAWKKLGDIVEGRFQINGANREQAFSFLSIILGRTLEETRRAYNRLADEPESNNGIFRVVYGLGKIAMDRRKSEKDHYREVSFTPTLRARIGHHIYGEKWAEAIKDFLFKKGGFDRPVHIISSNLHSVKNCLYGYAALPELSRGRTLPELALELGNQQKKKLREKVHVFAQKHGMFELEDPSGTNITVQIFDTAPLCKLELHPDLAVDRDYLKEKQPIIINMDYAFGEQAYETLDELLKSYEDDGKECPMLVESISIMGKAGVLKGGKGDIMLPTAHVFEGTADNYPLKNDFHPSDFEGYVDTVCYGPMITVLGTSLQNRDVLAYFRDSTWKAIGLEMEGAHYQKAIQAQAAIRGNIPNTITLRYAYYASDNPLVSGSTLASGSLGRVGVKPTYLITQKILEKVFGERMT
ncbi:MAG: hypothetical protein AAGA10_17300 [Bacteroidota bacterium]